MPFLHSLKLLFQQENLPRSIFVDRILFVIGIVGTPIELYVASMNGQVDWFSFGLRCVIFTLCLLSLIFSFVTERGKANSARMSMIYLILIPLQRSYSCYLTGFNFDYALLLLTVLPTGAIFMVSPKWMLSFMLISIPAICTALVLAEDIQEDRLRLSIMFSYIILASLASFSINYRMGVQLKQTNEKFRVLAEFSSDIIAMHDLKGVISYISPSVTTQAGYDADELIGQSAFYLIHEADRQQAVDAYRKVLETSAQPVQLEYRIMRKDGRPVWVEAIGTPVQDKNGRITHVVTTTRDISARKRAENEREIHNAQLLRINRELDEFAYVVSHDLKAPLRGIATLTGFIEEDMAGHPMPEEVQGHLKLMRDRTQRLERLINDILAYSRAGRSVAQDEEIDTAAFFKDLDSVLGLPKTFELVMEGEFPVLRTTRIYLEQVFSNLINNAVAHHDKGQGKITLRGAPAKGGWEFSVEDDGPGIDPKNFERIFEVFHQLPGTGHSQGTGIGLAVVRKVLTTLGGQIKVEGVQPRGTRFRVTWPLGAKRLPKI